MLAYDGHNYNVLLSVRNVKHMKTQAAELETVPGLSDHPPNFYETDRPTYIGNLTLTLTLTIEGTRRIQDSRFKNFIHHIHIQDME